MSKVARHSIPAHRQNGAFRAAGKTTADAQYDTDKQELAGVRLTHPDKVLYPEEGITKLELANYYRSIADWILPHIQVRPLVLVRCPDGQGKECFSQKHPGAGAAETLRQIPCGQISPPNRNCPIKRHLCTCACAIPAFVVIFCLAYVPGYSSQTPDDEKSIRVVVEGYLKAKQWKERLPFVQYASKQEEAILEKYEGREFQLQDPKTQKIQEFPRRPGFFLAKAMERKKARDRLSPATMSCARTPKGRRSIGKLRSVMTQPA